MLKSDWFTVHLKDAGTKKDDFNALQNGQFMEPSSEKSMNMHFLVVNWERNSISKIVEHVVV